MEYFFTIQLSHDFIIKTGNKSAFKTIKMTPIIPFKRPVMSILLNLNQSYYIIGLNLRNEERDYYQIKTKLYRPKRFS